MTDKSTAARRLAFRTSLGTVLVGAGVLASCNLAAASPVAFGDPEIAQVNGLAAYAEIGGVDHFQTDDWNVGIWVNNQHTGAMAGDLTVRDTESGDVLCELPEKALEGTADCPAFLGPGDHRVVAEVTKGSVTKTSAPVVIESYAPEIPADGVDPNGVTVAATGKGDRGGLTAVTLQGTPGDRVILRDTSWYTALDTTFDASGKAVAQVAVAEGETVQLPVETQRDGRRRTGTLSVTGDPKPYTHAEALTLVSVESLPDGSRTVVLRGTPGAWYKLRMFDPVEETEGTVPADGLVRWQPRSGSTGLSFWTHGDDHDQESGFIDLIAPPTGEGDGDGEDSGEQPGEPIVAVPGAGHEDPGFTLPVVAQPGPGAVDPGFTAPGAAAPAPVTLVGVEPAATADVARVTIQGRAGDSVQLTTTTGHFWFSGTLDQDGRASFDVWDFPHGEERTFTGVVFRDGAEREISFTATSNARKPVTAKPLEYVGTEQTDDGTVVTFRGTPGAYYVLSANGQYVADHVAEDGVIRWTVHIPEGQVVPLFWRTSGESGRFDGSREIAGPGVDDSEPGQISVANVEAAPTADVARVTIAGDAGDRVELEGSGFHWSGTLDDAGRATFDVWDFPNGEQRTYHGTVRRGTHTAETSITVTSAARKAVHADALELVGTDFRDQEAELTFRGTPGATFRFSGWGEGATYGTIPEDGLVRYTVFLDRNGVAELWWHTIGDDLQSSQDTVRVEKPITAEPVPGETDPGFTLPGASDGDQPGDGDGDGDQPGDGDADQPGDGSDDGDDGVPAEDVTAEIALTNQYTQKGVLRVQDRSLGEFGSYYAGVFIDGRQTEAVRVTGTLRTETIHTGDSGEHTLELRKDGRVLATVHYTVAEHGATAEPTDQFTAALVGVNEVSKKVSFTVQDAGLQNPSVTYSVQVWVDGRQVDAAIVGQTVRTTERAGGEPGEHTVELKYKDGRVLGGFQYTVPGGIA